ncbi:MAG: CZB domain-containing protein [Rufibacter sp.]
MPHKEERTLAQTIGKFDFEQARIKHVLFKSKLRALLYGATVDLEPVLSVSHCSLGKWIEEVALPKAGHLPEVTELDKVHHQMHELARTLWRKYQAGQQEEALQGLDLVDETAQKLLSLLDEIERKAIR